MNLKVEKILTAGIDPSKNKLSIVALRFPDRVVLKKDIPNTSRAISQLDSELYALARKENLTLVYAPEDVSQYGALLGAILKEKNRWIWPVNPAKVSRQKYFYGDQKTDHIDARSAAYAALREVDKMNERKEVSYKDGEIEEIGALKSAVQLRDCMVKTSVKFQNSLHGLIYQLWGCNYKELFSAIDGVTALCFWKEYPSPRKLKNVGFEDLKNFIFEKSRHTISIEKSSEKAEEILKIAAECPVLCGDKAMTFKEKNIIRIAEALQTINPKKDEVEKDLQDLLPERGKNLLGFAGIKYVRASELVSIIGNIERFGDRNKFAKYNGTAPREWSSGKRKKHYASKQYNRKLKNALMGIAVTAARCAEISKAYFEKQLKRGKTKSQAYKLLARRISDIIYAILKNNTPYDPGRHAHKAENESGEESGDRLESRSVSNPGNKSAGKSGKKGMKSGKKSAKSSGKTTENKVGKELEIPENKPAKRSGKLSENKSVNKSGEKGKPSQNKPATEQGKHRKNKPGKERSKHKESKPGKEQGKQVRDKSGIQKKSIIKFQTTGPEKTGLPAA